MHGHYTEAMFLKERKECVRLLKKCIKTMNEGPSKNGMKFVQLDPEQMEEIVVVDAAFETNPDKSSQIGVVAMIRDKKQLTNNTEVPALAIFKQCTAR